MKYPFLVVERDPGGGRWTHPYTSQIAAERATDILQAAHPARTYEVTPNG